MADILCGYTADRDETLVAYLYGDIEPPQRTAFDAHIVTCERCRHELEDLQRLRGQLQCWSAPEVLRPLAPPPPAPALLAPPSRAPGVGGPHSAQHAGVVVAASPPGGPAPGHRA